MDLRGSLGWRRSASTLVDFSLELSGGLLGSYFGAMVAALVTAVRASAPEQIEQSMRSGFGMGFAFWALSISIVNRVLIQGISRASIGKKIFKLEIISSEQSLTWTTMFTRWVVSVGSLAAGGAGYWYAFMNPENKTLHDLIAGTDVVPRFESATVEMEYVEERRSFEEIQEILVAKPEVLEEPVSAEVLPFPAARDFSHEDEKERTLADVISIDPDQANKKKAA